MISLFFSAVIVVLTLYVIMDLYLYTYDPTWRGIINSRHAQEKPYAFVLGASYAYPINATHVAESLEKNDLEYEIYNLADMSDTPSHRLKSLEHLISLKPEVVIYCVSITDFENPVTQSYIMDRSSTDGFEILNPKKEIVKILSVTTQNNLDGKFPTSPKERTILSIKYLIRGPEFVHNPFINYNITPVTDEKTFDAEYNFTFRGVDTSHNNEERIALQKIITELKKNNIKVILFTSPHHKVFLDAVGESNLIVFESIMTEIAEQNDIGVHFLHNKYEKTDIWRDPHHIAVNKDAIIYSDDIAAILEKELKN